MPCSGSNINSSTGMQELLMERDRIDALIAEARKPPCVTINASKMVRSQSHVAPLSVPVAPLLQPLSSSFGSNTAAAGPSRSRACKRVKVHHDFQPSWPQSAVPQYRVMHPQEFAGSIENDAHTMHFGSSHFSHSIDGSCSFSPTVPFLDESLGSYTSSAYLNTPLTPQSSAAFGTSFERAPCMSRNSSVSGALAPDFQMLRVKSNASQIGSDVFDFTLEEEQSAKPPIPSFDALSTSNDLAERTSSSLAFMGAGMTLPVPSADSRQFGNMLGPDNMYQPGTSTLHATCLQRSDSQHSAYSQHSTHSISPSVAQEVPIGSLGVAKPAKRAISKIPTKRPKPSQRLECHQCDKHPEGFLGTHELKRHIERAHDPNGKVWVCVDMSKHPGRIAPKKPLDSCKRCRQNKHYGAYYNAAAHIRRAHFNPKPKASRGRHSVFQERRGGNSGGDFPDIQVLIRQGWIKQIDPLAKPTTTQSAMAASLSGRLVPKSSMKQGTTTVVATESSNGVQRDAFTAQNIVISNDWPWSLEDSQFHDMGNGTSLFDMEEATEMGSNLDNDYSMGSETLFDDPTVDYHDDTQ